VVKDVLGRSDENDIAMAAIGTGQCDAGFDVSPATVATARMGRFGEDDDDRGIVDIFEIIEGKVSSMAASIGIKLAVPFVCFGHHPSCDDPTKLSLDKRGSVAAHFVAA
jgi:hypothetical protein